MKTQTSEFVTSGHPDKVADCISSYLLDRYMEVDPKVRYAVEVQIKDNFVSLAGEVTSTAKFTAVELADFVREAVASIGYSHAYALRWPDGATLDAEKITVISNIGQQSPDIAQGVDRDGWGDQGIFWGMACDFAEFGDMPMDHYLAKVIAEDIMAFALDRKGTLGIDIKTQVEVQDGKVSSVIVAVPMQDDKAKVIVEDIVMGAVKTVQVDEPKIVINGTGAYVRHASQGDCGTTGRKLVVDFYGGNCRIGGGSPWTKDPSKADLTLNVYARAKAMEGMAKHHVDTCYCSISCCIGQKDIRVCLYDGKMNELETYIESRPAGDIVRDLGLDKPVYFNLCRHGLFSLIGHRA